MSRAAAHHTATENYGCKLLTAYLGEAMGFDMKPGLWHVVLASLLLGTAGMGGGAGGCGGGTTDAVEIDNGSPGAGYGGSPAGSNANCGSGAGLCPCASQLGDLFCAQCSTDPSNQVCRYCQPNTYCPVDPCDPHCYYTNNPPPPPVCPSGDPVDCQNGTCCPNNFPICCADGSHCGTSLDACANLDNGSNGGGGGGGPGGGCGVPPGGCTASLGSDFTSAQTGAGCCESPSLACPSSCTDGCGNSWYEVGGHRFGPCPSSNNSCMQNAAAAATQACK